MTRLKKLLPDLSRIQAIIAIAVLVIGSLWGAYWMLQSTFTLARDFQKHEIKEERDISGNRALILQGDLRELRRERGQLLREKERKVKLTPYEQQRLEEVNDDIRQLEQKIKRLAPE